MISNAPSVRICFCIGIVLFTKTHCAAQANSGVSQSGWLAYVGDHSMHRRLGLHLEAQLRRSPVVQHEQQLLLRPGINVDLGKRTFLTLGYTFVRNTPPPGSNDVLGPEPRDTIYQQINREDRLQRFALKQAFRYEQTFGGSRRGHEELEWSFRQRVRYRLGAEIPLPHLPMLPSFASVYNEVAFSILPTGTRTVLNQNRTYAALGWKPTDKTSVEVGYMYQYRPVSNGIVAEQNNSIQFTVRSRTPVKQLFRRSR